MAFLAAAVLAAPAKVDNCTGNGCSVVTLDFDHCEARVSGATPVRLELGFNFALTGGQSGSEQMVIPGYPKKLVSNQGCLRPEQVMYYHAYLMLPTGQSSLSIGWPGPKIPKCTGGACNQLELEVEASCVWVSDRNAKPVAMTVRAGDQTIDIALDGADAAKAGPQSDIISSANADVDPECVHAHPGQKAMQDMASQLAQVPDNLDLDAALARCAKKERPRPCRGRHPTPTRAGPTTR